jgi:hypothetical protein
MKERNNKHRKRKTPGARENSGLGQKKSANSIADPGDRINGGEP